MTKEITTVAELNKAIDVWGRKGSTWVKEGVKLSLAALAHLSAHGDIGPINRLYCAMPKGTKSSSMAQWIMSFASVRVNEDTSDKAKPFVFAKDKKCDLAGAVKTAWYEFKPEPTVQELYDVAAGLRKVLAQAQKAANVSHREALAEIEAILEGIDKAEPATADSEE